LVPFNGESNLEFVEPLNESEGHPFSELLPLVQAFRGLQFIPVP